MHKTVTFIYKGHAATYHLGLTKRMGEGRIPFLKQCFARDISRDFGIPKDEIEKNAEVHIHQKKPV